MTYFTFDFIYNFHYALNSVLKLNKRLAAYLFTSNDEEKKLFTQKLSFGDSSINCIVMHLENDSLPFGGSGNSGMGRYHGKFSFETFSHQKAVLDRATWASQI